MLKKLKYIFGIIMLLVFIISLFYIMYIRITGEVPSAFGITVTRVYSEDMEPEIDIGEVVILQDVDPSELKLGDVITYKADALDFEDRFVTHQISKEPYEVDGVYYFSTRGLKSDAVDDPEIDESQLRGKLIYKIPFVGTVYDFITAWYGMIAVVIIVIVLYGGDVIALIRNFRKVETIYDEDKNLNERDVRQSERIESEREREFDNILTNLDIDE